jgi:hypothetical protein
MRQQYELMIFNVEKDTDIQPSLSIHRGFVLESPTPAVDTQIH